MTKDKIITIIAVVITTAWVFTTLFSLSTFIADGTWWGLLVFLFLSNRWIAVQRRANG